MLLFYFVYCQTSTSAVLQLEFVMSMPTARILSALIFARAKLDTLETEKHAKVDKRIMKSPTMSLTLPSHYSNDYIAVDT